MPRMPKPQPNPDYYSTSSIISRGSSTTNIKLKILENELREDLAPKNMVLLPNLNKQLNLDSDSLSFYIFDASDPNEKTRLKRLAITSLNKSIENKTEVAIETQNILNYKFVDKLPTIETAKSNTIYFVKDTEDRAGYIHDVDKNFYNEYLFVKESKTFEKLGGASLDLTAYRTAADQDLENIKLKNEIVAMFERVCQYKGTVLNVTDLPTGAKVGDIYKVINEAFSKNICAGDFMIKLDTGWDRLSSTIDSDLSVASINAVQNRIVTKALNKLADTKQDKLKEGKNDTFLHRNKETNELEWILGDNSGLTSYNEINDKPTLNGIEIVGNQFPKDFNIPTIDEMGIAVEKERLRAEAAEGLLANNIKAETERAILRENTIEINSGSALRLSHNITTGNVEIKLLNKLDTVIDTQNLSIGTEKIIKETELDYKNKKLIFTLNDDTTIECDITTLIEDLDTKISNEASRAKSAETTLKNTKVDKLSENKKVYVTKSNESGEIIQSSLNYDVDATKDTIVQRGDKGVINTGTPTLETHAATKKYVDKLVTDEGDRASEEESRIEKKVNSEISRVEGLVSTEKTRAEGKETSLQGQIDTLTASSDVADVVATKADLDAYNKDTLTDKAILKVLNDESQDNAITYYRFNKKENKFEFMSAVGPFYTKAETNTELNKKVDTVEGKQLSTEDFTTEEKTKLGGIEANANNYKLPAATAETLGGVKQGDNISIDSNGVISTHAPFDPTNINKEITGIKGRLTTDETNIQTLTTTKQDKVIGGANIKIATDGKTINWQAPIDGVYFVEVPPADKLKGAWNWNENPYAVPAARDAFRPGDTYEYTFNLKFRSNGVIYHKLYLQSFNRSFRPTEADGDFKYDDTVVYSYNRDLQKFTWTEDKYRTIEILTPLDQVTGEFIHSELVDGPNTDTIIVVNGEDLLNLLNMCAIRY